MRRGLNIAAISFLLLHAVAVPLRSHEKRSIDVDDAISPFREELHAHLIPRLHEILLQLESTLQDLPGLAERCSKGSLRLALPFAFPAHELSADTEKLQIGLGEKLEALETKAAEGSATEVERENLERIYGMMEQVGRLSVGCASIGAAMEYACGNVKEGKSVEDFSTEKCLGLLADLTGMIFHGAHEMLIPMIARAQEKDPKELVCDITAEAELLQRSLKPTLICANSAIAPSVQNAINGLAVIKKSCDKLKRASDGNSDVKVEDERLVLETAAKLVVDDTSSLASASEALLLGVLKSSLDGRMPSSREAPPSEKKSDVIAGGSVSFLQIQSSEDQTGLIRDYVASDKDDTLPPEIPKAVEMTEEEFQTTTRHPPVYQMLKESSRNVLDIHPHDTVPTTVKDDHFPVIPSLDFDDTIFEGADEAELAEALEAELLEEAEAELRSLGEARMARTGSPSKEQLQRIAVTQGQSAGVLAAPARCLLLFLALSSFFLTQ